MRKQYISSLFFFGGFPIAGVCLETSYLYACCITFYTIELSWEFINNITQVFDDKARNVLSQ